MSQLNHEWAPPEVDSEERDEMPASAFLSPSDRTYPYKHKIGGEWVISEQGLRSAISVANIRKRPDISRKAQKLLAEHFGDKEEDEDAEHSVFGDISDVEFLEHYGRLGMKWYQSIFGAKDAKEASARRGEGALRRTKTVMVSPEHKEAVELAKRGVQKLTTAELKKLNERMQAEQQYSNLREKANPKGRSAVVRFLDGSGASLMSQVTKKLTSENPEKHQVNMQLIGFNGLMEMLFGSRKKK